MNNAGKRAAEAILQRVGADSDYHKELDRLNLTRQSLHQWQTGKYFPSGRVLQRLAFAGYDVHYILTGERHDTRQKSISGD